MKKIILLLTICLSIFSISAQPLVNYYSKGNVKLVNDKNYGIGNSFEKIWGNNASANDRASLIVLSDGATVVNIAGKHYKFNADGKFAKEIILKNSNGKVVDNRKIKGYVGNQQFTNLDNMGKMICTDMDGNYVKTLTLNYMESNMVSMGNGKIAVVGWAIWKNKFRDFISIVDYQTNKEKIIWDKFTNQDEWGVIMMSSEDIEKNNENDIRKSPAYFLNLRNFPNFGYSYFTKGQGFFLEKRPIITFTNNELAVALPFEGKINFYDPQGNLKKTQKIEWKANTVSVEEQKRVLKDAIEKFRNSELPTQKNVTAEDSKKAREIIIQEREAQLQNIKEPIVLPLLASVIKDSDGNILFFEFPKETGGNLFHVWVYKNGGEFVCKSSFACDNYDLAITPDKIVFHNGYLYALQTKKDSSDKTMQLVRFKLEN